jgi:hypothetical protein
MLILLDFSRDSEAVFVPELCLRIKGETAAKLLILFGVPDGI